MNSWKEIAIYMGRGIRTVQRYEQSFGLPVLRLPGKARGAVIAFPSDLDHWLGNTPITGGGRNFEKSLIIAAIESVHCTILEGARLRQQSSDLRAAHQEAVQRLTSRIRELTQRQIQQ